VTLTSGGTKALAILNSGVALATQGLFATGIGSASTPAGFATGDLVTQRTVSTGALFLGGATSAALIDYGATTSATVTISKQTTITGVLAASNATAISAPAFGTASGDLVAQRSASIGVVGWGGATASAYIDFNIANANGFSARLASGTYCPIFGGAYTNSSDAALKTNVASISDAITKAMSLKPVSFDWLHDGSPSLGFLAQDVQQVLPELVSTDSTGTMGVNYDGIIPVVLAMQQEMVLKLRAAGVAGF
jgi:hypothetical protein